MRLPVRPRRTGRSCGSTQTFLRWTGYRREDLVGVKRFQDLLSVGGRIYHETHYAPLLRMQGAVREIAVDIVGADGRRLPVLVNSVLVRDADGDAAGRADDRLRRDRAQAATSASCWRRATASGSRASGSSASSASPPRSRRRPTPGDRRGGDRRAGGGARRRPRRRGGPDPSPASCASASATATVGADARSHGRRSSTRARRHGGAAVRLPLGTRRALLWLEFDASRGASTPGERAFLRRLRRRRPASRSSARGSTRRRATSRTRSSSSLLADAPPRDPRFEVATLYHAGRRAAGGGRRLARRLPAGRREGRHRGRRRGGPRPGGGERDGPAAQRGPRARRRRTRAGRGARRTSTRSSSRSTAARYATLAYAEVDPDTGASRSPRPGIRRRSSLEPGGAAAPVHGGPLAAARRRATRTRRAAGRLQPARRARGFLLYTDGLVERRSEPIDAGLERLLAAVRAIPGASPAELVDVAARAPCSSAAPRRRRLPAGLPPLGAGPLIRA